MAYREIVHVYKIAKDNGVDLLHWMTVMFAMVIIVPVQIVQEYQMEQQK